MESDFWQVCRAFRVSSQSLKRDEEPIVTGMDDLKNAIKMLRIADIDKFELERMLEDGINCSRTYSFKSYTEENNSQLQADEVDVIGIPVSALIAGCTTFRQAILNLKTDPIYCALLETGLSHLLSKAQLKTISQHSRELRFDRVGTLVYSSKKCNQEWYVLLSGRLKFKPEKKDTTLSINSFEIYQGEMFGGYDFFDSDSQVDTHFEIEVVQPCVVIEINGSVLENLLDDDPDIASDILDVLGTFHLFC